MMQLRNLHCHPFLFAVNMNLPVLMSESDAAQNPGCVNLLKALSQHLTEDGTSKHMEEAHKGVRTNAYPQASFKYDTLFVIA